MNFLINGRLLSYSNCILFVVEKPFLISETICSFVIVIHLPLDYNLSRCIGDKREVCIFRVLSDVWVTPSILILLY